MTDTIPIFFGGSRHIAGRFLRGAHNVGARSCAVLLCPPIGHEYMCSHGAFRRLSQDLATQGFAVLRFDYYGTGDSSGPQDNSSLLPAWIESLSLAADELRHRSGADTLAIVALRFGAILAATAIADRVDVSSLVLWSPCTSGRSLIRQTRMLAMSAAEHPGDLALEAVGIESAGFLLGAATVADISGMSMLDGAAYSVKNALILTRADGQPEQRLVAALAAAGVSPEEQTYENDAEFMVSPLHSVLPTGAINTIVQWLGEKYPSIEDTTASLPVVPGATSVRFADGTCESAVTFSDGRLVGILVTPNTDSENPAVVLLNTGADHRVGPHRMYVPLARRWASLGFPVLRFDLAGIGDSDSNDGLSRNESYPTSALHDVDDAIAYMRDDRRYSHVILAGMCSGAYHAIHGAGSRVDGVIAVNPPLYYRPGDPIDDDPYTNEAETRRVTRALRSPSKWRRLLSGRVDIGYTFSVLTGRAGVATRAIGAASRRLLTRRKPESHDVTTFFKHGVAMHLIFSEGDASQIFFERAIAPQLGRSSLREDFTIDIVPGADHTFMPIRWQRTLAELMTKRLLHHLATNPAPIRPPLE